MYNSYVKRLSSLGEQMNRKVTEINSVIDELEKKSKNIDATEFDQCIKRIRTLQVELVVMKDDLVKRNDELEQTVKTQNEKIKRLESCILGLKVEVAGLKQQQKQQGDSFQSQIDELKAQVTYNTQAYEKGISTLITEAKKLESVKGKGKDISVE